MTDNEIIGAAADALTEKARFAITIPVTVQAKLEPLPKRNLWDWLTRKPMPVPAPVETERELVFYPCKVANMARIAATALKLPGELISDDLTMAMLPIMADETNINNIIYIIAAAVQNNHLEPAKELIDFIKLNIDHEDMFLCFHGALGNSGMQSFLNSIVLAKSTIMVLKPEASPNDGSELIASHTAK